MNVVEHNMVITMPTAKTNKSTWLDWERAEEFKDIYNFVKI